MIALDIVANRQDLIDYRAIRNPTHKLRIYMAFTNLVQIQWDLHGAKAFYPVSVTRLIYHLVVQRSGSELRKKQRFSQNLISS